jgi:hypothetical protein
LGKQVRHPFPVQTTHVSSKSIRRCKYFMNFIDDHTTKVWVYFMKHKGEMFQHFLSFKNMVEKEKGVNIKCLRSNEEENIFQMNLMNT